MKILLPLFSFICLPMFFFSLADQKEEKNVEIILHLDKDMTEDAQTVYLWSFCDGGNQQRFWDSARIEKRQKTVTLQGYVPYDYNLYLCFSKNGPMQLYVYAQPKDTIELHISSKDRKMLWKKALRGEYHNIATENSLYDSYYWMKRRETSKDSVPYYSHLLMDRYDKILHESPYPQIANSSFSMLRMFFKDSIGNDSLQILKKYVTQKFSDYPPTVAVSVPHELSERTLKTQQRLNEISVQRKRYEQSKVNTKIGGKLSLKLPNANGELISLSDLKSKYIFLDIWASWCKPCRAQTPYLKAVLEKYKKDLKVYAVSIDTNHSAWKKAMEQDKTQEFIHVIGSDQERKKVEAVEALGIERIPKNFLLDRNCRIIAKDLLDDELMQTLDSLTKQ